MPPQSISSTARQTRTFRGGTVRDRFAGQGEVDATATGASQINAEVVAISVSGGAGVGSTPAASIGFSLARNLIGWTEYGGSNPIQIEAYSASTKLTADGASSSARLRPRPSTQLWPRLRPRLPQSGGTGTGLSAAGLWTDNKIAQNVQAYIDTSTGIKTNAGDISLIAGDNSTISADAQAVSLWPHPCRAAATPRYRSACRWR